MSPARALWTPGDDGMADLATAALAMQPDQLERWAATLDPDDLALVELAIAEHAALGWRSDPATMAAYLDPKFKVWRYVQLLSRKFREACDGVSKRQIWNLPARYGKSLLGSQWGPVWQLDRTGGAARFILVSFGATLARENAVGIRDRLTAHADSLRCHLRPDRRRMDRFVTDAGGGVLAAGMLGTIRGFGAGAGGGIIVDDPFKNWQEAHSENRRNDVWNSYRGTLLDRIDDEDTFIIIIHHRVHEDDLTGRLEEAMAAGGEQWDIVKLPALATSVDDPLGRAIGEPLEPERFSVEHHEGLRIAMGSYLFSGLQQQDPVPEEGTDLLRSWFDLAETMPTSPDDAVTSWDLKLKDKEQGDYVVGQAWWRVAGGYWLVDQVRGQYDHATTANAIALLAVRNPKIKRHVIEAAGSHDEVIPQLRRSQPTYEVSDEMASRLGMNESERDAVQSLRRRGMSNLIPNPPKLDKRVRARTYIAPTAEAGDVHLDASASWVALLLDELSAFPNGAHDDQVDAMSQALQRLSVGRATIAAPAGRRPEPRAGQAPTTVRPGAGAAGTARITAPGQRRRRPGPR